MAKYFKSKKVIRRNLMIKYFIIAVVVYFTLKISTIFLTNIDFLSNIYSLNKPSDYLKLIKKNTINNPKLLLNVNIDNNYINTDKIKMVDNIKEEIVKPKVYIYCTHENETYNDSKTTVKNAAYLLKEEFNKYNIDTFIEEGNITDFLITNNMDYGYSYVASRYFIENNIRENNYNLIIDLHRDAVPYDASFISFNNLPYAKILFVVGEEQDNYQENYDLAIKINEIINNKFPNLSRGVMLKSGPYVNGIYNQDLSNKMILLELGGDNNSVEEIKNTIQLIAPILGDYLYER